VTVKNAALGESITNSGGSDSDRVYSAVVGLLGEPASPSGDDFFAVIDQLKKLSWPSLTSVLQRLSQSGPGLESMTWLELFYERAKGMTGVDDRVIAATLAYLLAKGGRTLSGEKDVTNSGTLVLLLVRLSPQDQINVLGVLGLKDESAEGAVAMMFAAAMDAGVIVKPALAAAFDFGDWNLPTGQPVPMYMGLAAHAAIAAFYAAEHPAPAHYVATNTVPVDAIVTRLVQDFGFAPGQIDANLLKRMPDIFEFSMTHALPAPGIVYEIKPWSLAEVALNEAAMYCLALEQAGVPATLGPMGFAGTEGVVPAPNGYFVFETPTQGVIAYQYLRAKPAEIRVRDQARARSSKPRVTAESLQQAIPIPGATLAFYTMAAAIIALMMDGGWIIFAL
jgi:hypothetical protein